MAGKSLILITIVIVGVLVKHFMNKMEFFSLPGGFTFNDQSCELADLGVGSEDLALGRHGVLFTPVVISTTLSHEELLQQNP